MHVTPAPIGPLPRQRLYTTWDGYRSLAKDVASRQVFVGNDVQTFQQAIANRTGAKFALAAPMARTGIYLALRALISPGQSVILSPYTISDVINMVICAGGKPVFADIQAATCNLDPGEVERLIDSNTGAVLATHFYGLACNIERIADLCQLRGIALVEDAAQSFGTTANGRQVGTFGDAGVFSFGLYKNVTCFRGGMVITNRADVRDNIASQIEHLPFEHEAVILRAMASAAATDLVTAPPVFRPLSFRLFRFGQLHDVDFLNRRFAFDRAPKIKRSIPKAYLRRLTPGQARVALLQLENVDDDTAHRIRAAHRYTDQLDGLDGLSLPPHLDNGSHTYFYYPVQVRDREALVAYALRRGRDIAISHHRNCAAMTCFSAFATDCPQSAQAADSVVYLPTYPGYSDDEIDRTISVIQGYFGGSQ